MQLNEMRDTQRRVRGYWFEDGIGELCGGAMLLLLGVYFGLQGFFGERSPLTGMLAAGMLLIFIGGAYAVRRAVTAFKSRVTYPRTGFVEYRLSPEDTKRRRYGAMAVAFVLAAVLASQYNAIHSMDLVVLVSGLAMGLILIVLRGRAVGLRRFYLLGTLSILLGVVLSISRLSQPYGLGLLYGLLGLAAMLSGSLTLRRYLAQNPPPAEA